MSEQRSGGDSVTLIEQQKAEAGERIRARVEEIQKVIVAQYASKRDSDIAWDALEELVKEIGAQSIATDTLARRCDDLTRALAVLELREGKDKIGETPTGVVAEVAVLSMIGGEHYGDLIDQTVWDAMFESGLIDQAELYPGGEPEVGLTKAGEERLRDLLTSTTRDSGALTNPDPVELRESDRQSSEVGSKVAGGGFPTDEDWRSWAQTLHPADRAFFLRALDYAAEHGEYDGVYE